MTMLLLGGLLLLWPQPTAAQAEPITWQIAPGFNGAYRAGAWFPLRVTLANSGPDVRGTLELRFRDGQSSTFSQTVELPHNGRKQLVLPVASDPNQSGQVSADLVLRNGTTVVRQERINLNGQDSFVRVVGVISDQGGALPELANLFPPERGTGALVRFSPAELPERAELLQTFNVLFVHATDTTTWSPAQRAAIEGWVRNGGQLVVGGDPLVTRGLAPLLPATFIEAGDQSSLRGLGVDTGWDVRDDAPVVPVLRLTAAPDAEVVLRGDDDLPLVVRRWSGVGLVLQTAFGLETLREAGDAASFWPSVLALESDQGWGWVDLRSRGRDVLEQSLRLPGLRLPSVLGMLSFMLLYILTIGPLNYLLLRRLQRREWAYLTIPLLVLLFSGGAYVWGTAGRGSAASVTELSVVRVGAESARGQASTFVALFSPTRRTYELQAEPEALVASLQRQWERSGNDLQIVFGESSVRVPSLLVDVGGVRTLSAEHSVDVPQLVAQRIGDDEVLLRNRSDQPIEDLVLVNGQGLTQEVATLGPGQERRLRFEGQQFVSPSFGNGANGTLNREVVFQQLSTVLFAPSNVNIQPMPLQVGPDGALIEPGAAAPPDGASQVAPRPDQQLFVLGWESRATLPLRLNGRASDSLGETVYIWPVGKEQ